MPMGFLFDENMSDLQTPTLRELVQLAFPIETRVFAERGWLERPVTWVVSTSANGWARLASGDLAFLLPPHPNDLAAQFMRLAQVGVAGIAVVGDPPPGFIDAAHQAQVPLVAVPPSADLRQGERLALSYILNHDVALEQHVTQLYQQLTGLSAENAGLEAMADLIGRTTNRTVLIQDKRLNVIAAWFAPEDANARTHIEGWVAAPINVPEALRDRKRAAQSRKTLEQLLPELDRARVIAPIVAKGMARGFLSLIAGQDTLGQFDRNERNPREIGRAHV